MTVFPLLPPEECLAAIESHQLRSERIAQALDGLSRLAQTDHNLHLAAALDVLSEALHLSAGECLAALVPLRRLIVNETEGETVQ